jgi:hypothetical protein
MQEDNINFEEIGKDETAHAEQSSALFKQPIRGHYDSLHEELKARCAPENFMNPYEPEKVSRANKLYSEILSIDKNDDEKLKLLRLRAMEELGIKFSTEQLFEKLTAACNPKNFTGDSYNEERLELANGLYQQILMNADDIFALEEVEEKAKELLDTYNPHPNSPDNFVSEDINTMKESIFVVLFVFILIFIIIMLLSN